MTCHEREDHRDARVAMQEMIENGVEPADTEDADPEDQP